MKYRAEIHIYGLGSGVVMIAEDELAKSEWEAQYLFKHELRVRAFKFYTRETKRHGWKLNAKVDWLDKRGSNLSDMPCPPPELCDLAIKKWGEISVNWQDWSIR